MLALLTIKAGQSYLLILVQGPRLLAYDLDLLSDYVERKRVKKLVLALRDSEAFDLGVLTDLLSLLRYNSLPNIFLFIDSFPNLSSAPGLTAYLLPCCLESPRLLNYSKVGFPGQAPLYFGVRSSKYTTQETALIAYMRLFKGRIIASSGSDVMSRVSYLRNPATPFKARKPSAV